MLLGEGCSVVAYDPAAMERATLELRPSSTMSYAPDAYEAARDADALLILTDWKEFAGLDLRRLHSMLRYPIVVDGRNMFDPAVMQEHGFTYLSIGRPTTVPAREAVSAAIG
jgi:UDPglucose 6-dehydrogenase